MIGEQSPRRPGLGVLAETSFTSIPIFLIAGAGGKIAAHARNSSGPRLSFFFFSREGHEPRHIYVEQAERYVKFWLEPIELVESR